MSGTESATNSRRLSPLASSFASSRSKGIAVIVFLACITVIWLFMTHKSRPEPVSASVKPPTLQAPAGGDNHSELIDRVGHDKELSDAREAREHGKSYASALATASAMGDDKSPSLGHAPGDSPKQQPTAFATPSSAQVKPPSKPQQSVADDGKKFTRDPGARDQVSTRKGTISESAEAEMLAAWGGRAPSLDMEIPENDGDVSSGAATTTRQKSSGNGFTRTTRSATGITVADDTDKQDSATTKGTTSKNAGKHLLLAAGRGVYGHAVLTANSDVGGEALIQIDSGSLTGARVSGSFEMKNDRLVIKFNKLMIGDNDPISVSAYAVSPDTAEAGVASEVHEHLATRIILPTAAAFVEGLGNAMQSTNTSSYTSGLGLQSFTNLTLPQQLGVAAGKAGQAFGQIIQKQTPQQATVLLNKGDPVGVLFDEPVYAP